MYSIENLLFNILWYLCPQLIINGHVYSSEPPLSKITTTKNKYIYIRDDQELQDYKKQHHNISTISRMKGLGEMDSDELAQCLLDKDSREIIQLTVSDVKKTDILFNKLYGKAVAPRVKFIEQHAEEAEND